MDRRGGNEGNEGAQTGGGSDLMNEWIECGT